MWHIGHGLGYLAEFCVSKFIQQHREYNGKRKAEQQKQQVNGERIPHGAEKVWVFQKRPEML